ncbi:MAG TPA: diacylglycerol kinase family protein [Candidatus Limnocylindria bacterium]|nr:diacylglycerol kinase family protein [Candidatus Limnocylindria bacterium]
MPTEQTVIILNPAANAGRASALRPWLAAALRELGARLVVTSAAGEAEQVAAAAAADGWPRVVAVGGDGTVQEAINGIMAGPSARRPVLGVLAAGSGNDLARSLRLPRARHEALAVAVNGDPIAIDVAEAADASGRRRHFASAGGTGFDAQVAHAMARPRGRWQRGRVGYLLSTLAELRRYRNARLSLRWEDGTAGSVEAELRALMVAFANGAYYGGGMRIAPEARLDDGLLDLCIVGDITRREAVRQLPGLYRGAHVTHPAVRMARAGRLEIDGEPSAVHLDGEPFGQLPLRVTVRPRALGVATVPSAATRR